MIVKETHFEGLKLWRRGKVRDVYDLDDSLLIVATDRLSAFDVVMEDPIPDKGRMLTQLSEYWFEKTSDITANHVISFDMDDFPDRLKPFNHVIEGRSMWVKKAEPLAIECIVRGYLAGSAWQDYKKTGQVCGHVLASNLVESQKLPEPLFTPSTKAKEGSHDENISIEQAAHIIGKQTIESMERVSIEVYKKAAARALEKGIIIADTKFEFGFCQGELILIDELITPDSSRFWPADKYSPGRSQASFDKQFVRDYLESIKWNKKPPAPRLPLEVIEKTRQKYEEAVRTLTSDSL